VRSERKQLPRVFEKQHVFFVISAALAMRKILFFSRPQKQQQLHHHMEKREVDQEELAATWCATAIPLYPATTFAEHRTSSESTPDTSSGGTQRSRKL